MKARLLIQSLSPLALLAFLKNCPTALLGYLGLFTDALPTQQDGSPLPLSVYLQEHIFLIILLCICFLWVLLGIYFILRFAAFRYTNKTGSYNIGVLEEKTDASMSFFLTLILPLATNWQNSPREMLLFILTLALIICLLWKSTLFYDNPVLSVLGYRVYRFTFTSSEKYGKNTYIGVCRAQLTDGQAVCLREIERQVFYVEEVKKCK